MDFALTHVSILKTPLNWVLEVKNMQRIAASVPDIAALPVNVNVSDSNLNNSNEQFKHLLKDHNSQDRVFQQPGERAAPRIDSSRDRRPQEQQSSSDSRVVNRKNADQGERIEPEGAPRQGSKLSDEPKQALDNTRDDKELSTESDPAATNETDPLTVADKPADEELESDDILLKPLLEEDVDWLALLQRIEDNALATEGSEKKGQEDISLELTDEIVVQNKSADVTEVLNTLINQEAVESEQSAEAKGDSLLDELAQLVAKLNDDIENGDRADLLVELQGLLAQLLKSDSKTEGVSAESADELTQLGMEEFDLALLQSLFSDEGISQELESEQLGLFEEEELSEALLTETDKPLITETPVLSSDTTLEKLLKLDPEKLDMALKNLADRLNEQGRLTQTENTDQVALLSEEVPDISLKLFSHGEDKAQFIANMKSGLKEMANQLKQGHEPGINLKSLVEDSLNKTLSGSVQNIEVQPVQLDVVLQSFGQAIDLSSQLQSHSQQQTHLLAGLDRGNIRESGLQAQIESNKQAQVQSSFERAVNINRPEGHTQLADKVRWMVNQNNLTADIRLDPPELGSMKVKVQVNGEAATVNFVVQSQQARDVFEQNAPRLKELLEEQGIQLGQSSVQQEQNGSETQDGELAGQGSQLENEQEDQLDTTEQPIINGRIGGIDYFV